MSLRAHAWILALPLLSASGCGGGGGDGPTTPSTPPPATTYPVSVVVFYDENGNGLLDGNEVVRMPAVEVVAGSATARTERSGRAVLQAPAGTQTVAIRTETLPPYWVPTAGETVTVPGAPEVRLPVRLPIGDNQQNVYVAFGDSLTTGFGSTTGDGYRRALEGLLGGYFGQGYVTNAGRAGTFSSRGAERIPGVMSRERPAYTLILYGTNDWNDQRCQSLPPSQCFTIDSLATIVDYVKQVSSYPVLATLPPTNPALAPSGRTEWNAQMNTLIKGLAQSKGAIVADLFAAFPTAPGDLPRYFFDDVHPNDQGYALMAQAFMKALGTSRSGQPGLTAAASSHASPTLLPATAVDAGLAFAPFAPPPTRGGLRSRSGPVRSGLGEARRPYRQD